MEVYDLSGLWQCEISGKLMKIRLPGTLDENGIGEKDTGSNQWHPDETANSALITPDGLIATRFTRKHTYEGPAVFMRELCWQVPQGMRIFLECERSRHLTLRVNGQIAAHFSGSSISTPHVFEVTGMLKGEDRLELICDNSYPGWPRGDIVYSSAATDETQTNWNGVLGNIRLRIEEPVFISSLRVYPHADMLDVCTEVSADRNWEKTIEITCSALEAPARLSAGGQGGVSTIWLRDLPLAQDARRWDEEEGNLYALTAALAGQKTSVTFGVRDFAARDGRLTLNGRNIFLRSESNCAVFPENGYSPTDIDSWKEILSVYRSYGVNCMRFHSHCPPEAAFMAADEMGMLMQPELSHWNPKDAFFSQESRAYYRQELEQILRMLSNHPSFVMLTLGNELHADEAGHAYMAELLHLAREIDPTRLYADGSNTHYGKRGCDPASDFYTSFAYRDLDLRATSANMLGWLNEKYPDLSVDYAPAMAAIRKDSDQPVFSFEVGQYEVLPDSDELEDFKGVTIPGNLKLILDKVKAKGLVPRWKQYVEATGELSLLCYRAEVEAALRTQGMSGISLLGLQDFPGQGTALVGMLNSHLQQKPHDFARPERFRSFFTGALPLVLLGRCTYRNTDMLTAPVRMANYMKAELRGKPAWALCGEGIALHGAFDEICAKSGGLSELGALQIPLHMVKAPSRLELTVSFCGHQNTYPVWVYPDEAIACPENVYECRAIDGRAMEVLAGGGTVYLAPDSTKEALPKSIQGQFSTDFWSVGTFSAQEGGMGLLIDETHPIFEHFPTEMHTNWQWWPMASGRAVILPEAYDAIITQMDSYAYLRPMAMLLECRCGGGKLLLSTMGLHRLTQYPEAAALQNAVYRYLSSDRFAPEQEIAVDILRQLVK